MFGLPPVQTSESIMDSEVLLFSPVGGILAIDKANVCRYTILNGERLP
jgi:hypothetical protein